MLDEAVSNKLSDRHDPMEKISVRLADSGRQTMLSTGDHAALRRMYLTNKTSATGVTVKLLLEAGVEARTFEHDWEAWKLVVHVAALISGTGRAKSHAHWRGYGTALRNAESSDEPSDKRLLSLMAAKGELLRDKVAVATRLIIRGEKSGPINLWQVLDLVGNHNGKAEAARLRIALDYYSA